MEVVTIETLPVEASMSGKNVCYLHCPSINRRSNYGVCLFTINAYNKGTLSKESDCYSLVGRGLCEALNYQKQEQEAGRALFYKEREIKVVNVEADSKPSVITSPSKPDSPSYMRGWNQVGQKANGVKKGEVSVIATGKGKKSSVFGTETADLSDAVDEAVKADKEKKARTIKPGMSILERARAMSGGE